MPLVPLSIPFGVYRNGTNYAAKNRWFETSLVRWHDGALRSIGGWSRRLDSTTSDPVVSLRPLTSELVVNGGFDTDTSSWDPRKSAVLAAVSGELRITASAEVDSGARQTIAGLTIGKTYKASGTARRGTCLDSVGMSVIGIETVTSLSTVDVLLEITFVATATSHNLKAFVEGGLSSGLTAFFDDMSFREVTISEFFRDSIAWRTNNGSLAAVFGSNYNLRYMNAANQLATITPVGFPLVPATPPVTPITGYGGMNYGEGPYGVTVSSSNAEVLDRWVFDTWGEDLLMMNVGDGVLYSYTTGDANAVAVPNAPDDLQAFVVTDERIVMTLGGTLTPRLVTWCEQENREGWTSEVDNQAGAFTLAGSGAGVSIIKVQNMNLIITETDIYTARYTGPPYVYRFDRVGSSALPFGDRSVVSNTTFAMWIGLRNIWMFDGALKEVPCDIIDYIIGDIDPVHVGKIHASSNTDFSEMWWYYQSSGSTTGEVDSYFVYNYEDKFWFFGKLDRLSSLDRGASNNIIAVDADGFIYDHELAAVKVDGESYAETGPIELGQGDQNLVVRYIYPDTTVQGAIEMTLFGKAMPSEPEYTYGPYTYNNPTPTRAMGREIRLKIEGLTTQWEVGTMRLDVTKGGQR